MINKTTLNMLTQDSASVKTTNEDGLMHRKAYVNSAKGRREVIEELPEDIQNEILLVWGNNATITEPEPEPIDDTPQPPTLEEKVIEQEKVINDLVRLLADKGVIW